MMVILGLVAGKVSGQGWEIQRTEGVNDRPAINDDGVVTITIGQKEEFFPRYLNELDIRIIRIRFNEPGGQEQKLSLVWTGGSEGEDRFAVKVDGVEAGISQEVNSANRPYFWYRDDFTFRLGAGGEHEIEISSPVENKSALEFAGMRLARPEAPPYQPLCYESIGTREKYEKEIKQKAVVIKAEHLWVFAPARYESTAKELAAFLEKAYGQMKKIYGMDTMFKFSVENYPEGYKRGWGGISGAGTIGYTYEALTRFAKLKTSNVRGFAGYTEEMSHGFKSYYKCDGTYEALGVAIQEDVVRSLVSQEVADKFWLPEHRQWDETHRAYLAAGNKNPDPAKYPWNVLYTRILNDVFLKLRSEYGPQLWPDFFATIRKMNYPLHRAKKTERMTVYADIFTQLFGRDMRKEFNAAGIELGCDPPWGALHENR